MTEKYNFCKSNNYYNFAKNKLILYNCPKLD